MRCALVGNPNSGKTTLYNSLTGSSAHVGNWGGVTVGKSIGVYKTKEKRKIEIVDLPGIYSMSPYTPEEIVSRNFVLAENPDVIINIVDATNLERNLYLTTQLLELDIPIVVALNMCDALEKSGDKIDTDYLKNAIGVPVVKISALKEKGLTALMKAVEDAAKTPRSGINVFAESVIAELVAETEILFKSLDKFIPSDHEAKANLAQGVAKNFEKDIVESSKVQYPQGAKKSAKSNDPKGTAKSLKANSAQVATENSAENYTVDIKSYESNSRHACFHVVKLIEQDEIEKANFPQLASKVKYFESLIDSGHFEGDFEGIVADCRYKYITNHYAQALEKNKDTLVTRTQKIDKVLTHKIWGIPIFIAVMFFLFHLTFSADFLYLSIFIPQGSFDNVVFGTDAINSPGMILSQGVAWITDTLLSLTRSAMPVGSWYSGLICDGLLSGIFSVINFIPQIMVLFLLLSILEDSGYMARIAFIMDKFLLKVGLSGKAFVPLLMCFGCAVPGIMATRTLENEGEKKRTILIAPFFSCGAKLPIWAAFAAVFAHQYAGLNAEVVVLSMYLLGIIVAVLAALILKKSDKKSQSSVFLMELPNYHMPQAKNLGIHLWDKLKHYIIKVSTIVAGATIVLWVFTTFSFTFKMVEPGESMLAIVAKGITWLFVPLGWGMGENGWMFVVATFSGILAKELAVATLGSLGSISGGESAAGQIVGSSLGAIMLTIGGTLGGINVSIPAMFSFMAFNLLCVPCVSAVAAARGEFRALSDGKVKRKFYLLKAMGFWMATAYVVSMFIFWFGTLICYKWWIALIVGISLVAVIALIWTLSAKGLLKFKKKTEV